MNITGNNAEYKKPTALPAVGCKLLIKGSFRSRAHSGMTNHNNHHSDPGTNLRGEFHLNLKDVWRRIPRQARR